MRKRTWLVLGALALALAAIVWLAARDAGARRIGLLDGREFAVKAVTFGTEHRYVHASAWARAIEPIIPNRFKSRLGIRTLAYKTEAPTLMVWAHWKFARTNAAINYASVVDRHDTESLSIHHQRASFLPRFEAIMGWNFSNYPRRERAFRFRLYPSGNSTSARLAELVIPNPAPTRAAPFDFRPLPQTTVDNGIEFALTELTVGGLMPKQWRLPYRSPAPWNIAAFRITENGNSSPSWKVDSLGLSDASGNQANCRFDSMLASAGEIRCRFTDVLWPDERAYKLTAEFVRTTNFVPEELWTAESVPVPTGRNRVRIAPNIELRGVKITSLELSPTVSGPAAAGALRPTAHLLLRTLPPTRGIRPLLSHARDNRGQAVKFEEVSLLQNGTIWFALEISSNASNIDLTFAITRSRFVNFVAQAERF
jgi:hypothetical protein